MSTISKITPVTALLSTMVIASACTPPPPSPFDGLDGVSAKAVTVILGAPLVDDKWDEANGPVTWRREVIERHSAPRRIFRNGRFHLDGYTNHEFLLTCDLTARISEGRIQGATLIGPARACDVLRSDAQKVTALVDVLQETSAVQGNDAQDGETKDVSE